MAPAFERREHHEQISRTVTLIFVIRPRGLSWLYRNRCTRFGSQLLRGLVQANERNIWIARPRVHGQHVFHGRHERAAATATPPTATMNRLRIANAARFRFSPNRWSRPTIG